MCGEEMLMVATGAPPRPLRLHGPPRIREKNREGGRERREEVVARPPDGENPCSGAVDSKQGQQSPPFMGVFKKI